MGELTQILTKTNNPYTKMKLRVYGSWIGSYRLKTWLAMAKILVGRPNQLSASVYHELPWIKLIEPHIWIQKGQN